MRSWAVIDLDRLVANYRAVSRAAGPAVTLLNVIKADAYGHGSAAVCRALEAAGAAHFAVSNLDEAAALRNAGSKAALVVLNGLEQREAPDAAALGAQPFLNTKQQLEQWSAHGRKLGRRLPCHLKLNTGMNRSGFDFDPACPTRKASFLNMLHEAAGIAAAGVATHFASAENFASPAAAEQLDLFAQQVAALASSGIRPRYVHAANSAALAYRRDEPEAAGLQCTMARPGLALYGYLIDSAPRGRKAAFAVSPILQWKTRLLEIRRVRAGAAVGYGAAYRAVRDMQIGVAAAGLCGRLPPRLVEPRRGCRPRRALQRHRLGQHGPDPCRSIGGARGPHRGRNHAPRTRRRRRQDHRRPHRNHSLRGSVRHIGAGRAQIRGRCAAGGE